MLCNAGISEKHTGITEDGFDVVFETNHLGHFLLTKSEALFLTRQLMEYSLLLFHPNILLYMVRSVSGILKQE